MSHDLMPREKGEQAAVTVEIVSVYSDGVVVKIPGERRLNGSPYDLFVPRDTVEKLDWKIPEPEWQPGDLAWSSKVGWVLHTSSDIYPWRSLNGVYGRGSPLLGILTRVEKPEGV